MKFRLSYSASFIAMHLLLGASFGKAFNMVDVWAADPKFSSDIVKAATKNAHDLTAVIVGLEETQTYVEQWKTQHLAGGGALTNDEANALACLASEDPGTRFPIGALTPALLTDAGELAAVDAQNKFITRASVTNYAGVGGGAPRDTYRYVTAVFGKDMLVQEGRDLADAVNYLRGHIVGPAGFTVVPNPKLEQAEATFALRTTNNAAPGGFLAIPQPTDDNIKTALYLRTVLKQDLDTLTQAQFNICQFMLTAPGDTLIPRTFEDIETCRQMAAIGGGNLTPSFLIQLDGYREMQNLPAATLALFGPLNHINRVNTYLILTHTRMPINAQNIAKAALLAPDNDIIRTIKEIDEVEFTQWISTIDDFIGSGIANPTPAQITAFSSETDDEKRASIKKFIGFDPRFDPQKDNDYLEAAYKCTNPTVLQPTLRDYLDAREAKERVERGKAAALTPQAVVNLIGGLSPTIRAAAQAIVTPPGGAPAGPINNNSVATAVDEAVAERRKGICGMLREKVPFTPQAADGAQAVVRLMDQGAPLLLTQEEIIAAEKVCQIGASHLVTFEDIAAAKEVINVNPGATLAGGRLRAASVISRSAFLDKDYTVQNLAHVASFVRNGQNEDLDQETLDMYVAAPAVAAGAGQLSRPAIIAAKTTFSQGLGVGTATYARALYPTPAEMKIMLDLQAGRVPTHPQFLADLVVNPSGGLNSVLAVPLGNIGANAAQVQDWLVDKISTGHHYH